MQARAGKAVIVTGDFVRTGGMDRANYALASYLAQNGHDIELVAHRVASELVSLPNVHVHQVTRPLHSHFLGRFALAAKGRRVATRISSTGGCVVVNGGNCYFEGINWVHYVHAAYQCLPATSFVERSKHRVVHSHSVHAETRALRIARTVICNSRRTQTDVVEKLRVPPDKTRVVYLGTDPNEFYPIHETSRQKLRADLGLPLDRPVAAFIGAPGDYRKGFDVLHAAWKELRNNNPLLVVIGGGRDLRLWRTQTAEAGLTSSISYLGFRSDVSQILRCADLVVSPTRYEPYGLAVQESLCCGVPAIVSARAGIAEKYPDDLQDLLITDVENAAALSEQIKHVFSNLESYRVRCAPLGAALRSRTWDHTSAEIAAIMSIG